ncbi:tetratricopeptide repeat protein [Urechidicola vernalis]|uniref:Tetratricopeptide repeat protein n=1 Tax=Urechidicola vernalis TaxID=3075600 RepID=A0ABU2Y7Q2_9FLAO|nr:tetratricopeptide repeat protein [Urechidicola sp. P050]MDT0554227.1 tetratricopeptide repeat protein [Urechidicola sp. P050]
MKNLIIILVLFCSALLYGQDQQLAYDYFRKGEYEKSASIYKVLYEENNFNSNYFTRLIYCYRQLEDYTKTEEIITNHLKKYPNQIQFYVELGYNYELQYDHVRAKENYDKAINGLQEKQSYGYSVGRAFQNNHLLDYALQSYQIVMDANPNSNFNIQIATIYGEKGEIDNMFNAYLDMVEKNEKYRTTILRYVGKYITDDSENEYNILFKNLLLKRLQSNQLNSWNQLLSWLFMQQKQYGRAFIQEKALHMRDADSIGLIGIKTLGEIAFRNEDFNTSKNCFTYVLEHAENPIESIDAKLYLLYVFIETESDLEIVDEKFQELFSEYGINSNTIDIQVAYADFLTFKRNQSDKSIDILKNALNFRSDDFEKGNIKLKLGDVLVFKGSFNEALIYYSQVQTKLKNHVLAQEARFKVAQTSFYKGDFKWAQTQLKVLKGSTSQLIANDALDLSLIIDDNTVQDSLKTALKLYAKSDLLAFQNKDKAAIDSLSVILTEHKGHAIEDETLFKQAEIFEKIGDLTSAESNYLKLIEINTEDILVDDAYFKLAELYFKQNNTEKAKEYYQKIIFDFPSSIHLVEARKKFRTLRGDDLQ